MKKTLFHEGKELIYELNEKNVKNINLRIQRDGKVVVSKHKNVSNDQVEAFLMLKWDWIFEAIEKMKKTQRIQSRPDDLNSIRLFGKVLPIIEKKGSKRLVIMDDCLFFYSSANNLDKKLQELQVLLEKAFIQYIEERKSGYDCLIGDYGIAIPQMKYRYLKGRWGSCDIKKKTVTMSYNLLYYDKDAIDYVLLHEYAHLVVPNHSKRFHDFLKHHMPDYKRREDLLKAII